MSIQQTVPAPPVPPVTAAPPFPFGIEEEFFVVELDNKRLASRSRPYFLRDCRKMLGELVHKEMLQSQLEIATPVLADTGAALEMLRGARRALAELADRHDLAIVASGTYPLAAWREQQLTKKTRYREMRNELQIVGWRNVLCGMHVHVAPPPNASRIDLMNRALPFLPLLLALSTSSPFWQMHRTGMKGYRLAAYDELPRTGLPVVFRNDGEYQVFVDTLVSAGAIPDATHIWWAIRPSCRFPTLELRVPDSCTLVEDTLCIAALFRCVLRALWRNPTINSGITSTTRLIVDENRWRAQRFGIEGSVVDLAAGRMRPITDMVEEMLALVHEDAAALGCEREVDHARTILRRGTSADQQLKRYFAAREAGESRQAALTDVAEWLVTATRGISL
jgi:carboxylate-amine ligase